jgi:pimeloyl-ACP methyl ester carboxylesterase
MLAGTLDVPERVQGIVIFAHGSGSSRHSPRNAHVAGIVRDARIATLLLDLLTPEEDADPEARFDIALLTERLGDAVRFVSRRPATCSLRIGLFGASTGAASALRLAAEMPEKVRAVVSRGGRPDLAGDQMLPLVRAPTLLIVGGADRQVLALNRAAARYLQCEQSLVVVPGASHLFEEPGTLDRVAVLAREWFARHLVQIPVDA